LKRLDDIEINEALHIVDIFNCLTDSDEGFLKLKEAEAYEQHTGSIISALRAARREESTEYNCD